MKHDETQHDDIHDAVRSALSKELPKALESFLTQLGYHPVGTEGKPDLVSRKQAAAALCVSLQTIASLLSDGTLQSVRVRRRVLVTYSSIVSYVNRQNHSSANGEAGNE